MVGLDARATMDLDATIKDANVSLTDVETIISNIIAIHIDDGVSFHIKRIAEIMEEADYPGVRVSMETKFDGASKDEISIGLYCGVLHSGSPKWKLQHQYRGVISMYPIISEKAYFY